MKNNENKNYKFIKSKSEITNKMNRIKEVFDLNNIGYTSKEIAKMMDLPIEMIRFWMGSTYFYILERKTQEKPIQRDDGNSLWLDNKIYTEMNRRLDKKKNQQKNKKKILKKAS